MPKLDILSTSAKKTATITVSKKIFDTKVSEPLMNQAVRVYLSNQRQANAQTKSRGEIITTKKKVWRQKGTGRARHGSRNAPIFVGGAKAHGPPGEQNFKRKMTKTMRQKSLFSALTTKFKDQAIMVVNGLDKLTPKTKQFDKTFTALTKTPKKVLLLLDKKSATIDQGSRNLPYLTTNLATNTNTYQVLNANKIIFTKESLKVLEAHYLKK
ncbi:50S ribosomal protein L4 [Patescibacteria group bacterium]